MIYGSLGISYTYLRQLHEDPFLALSPRDIRRPSNPDAREKDSEAWAGPYVWCLGLAQGF